MKNKKTTKKLTEKEQEALRLRRCWCIYFALLWTMVFFALANFIFITKILSGFNGGLDDGFAGAVYLSVTAIFTFACIVIGAVKYTLKASSKDDFTVFIVFCCLTAPVYIFMLSLSLIALCTRI